VNRPSGLWNRGAVTRLEPATSPEVSIRRRRTRTAREASVAAAGSKTRFTQAQPAKYEWETVQEMFLASRSRFVALAHSILRNQEDAEDAVQDAMLSAYLHLRNFEGRSAFTTWFTRIVFNAALMIRRKRKPARIESFPDSGENNEVSWIEKIPAPQPDPEMVCAGAETLRSIDGLLQKMTPVLRQAFTMIYYDELSVEEAGALLGVAKGTFKARAFRARKRLVREMQSSLVVPIPRATHTLACCGRSSFTPSATNPSEIRSSKVAYG
jgi:RNA polymerase sigma-70 factor, ECF subfamily